MCSMDYDPELLQGLRSSERLYNTSWLHAQEPWLCSFAKGWKKLTYSTVDGSTITERLWQTTVWCKHASWRLIRANAWQEPCYPFRTTGRPRPISNINIMSAINLYWSWYGSNATVVVGRKNTHCVVWCWQSWRDTYLSINFLVTRDWVKRLLWASTVKWLHKVLSLAWTLWLLYCYPIGSNQVWIVLSFTVEFVHSWFKIASTIPSFYPPRTTTAICLENGYIYTRHEHSMN